MKTTNAKVVWVDVCKPKHEGGLGIRSLKVANMVSCLKLIWWLWVVLGEVVVDAMDTHVSYSKEIVLVFTLRETSQAGSWLWRKILNARELAKAFHLEMV